MAMRTRRLHPWMLLVVVCAASPLVLNVAVSEIAWTGRAYGRAEGTNGP